ncbi:MAG: rubrerythrin, partial [Actinomycetota bacterium]
KTHVGEFQALLLSLDKQQVAELEAGKKEVEKELKD